MPGMPEVLRQLSGREDALVGLLTGNIEAGARVKLAPTGLWPLFRVGAYGSDDMDRPRLPPLPRGRARALARPAVPFGRGAAIGGPPPGGCRPPAGRAPA